MRNASTMPGSEFGAGRIFNRNFLRLWNLQVVLLLSSNSRSEVKYSRLRRGRKHVDECESGEASFSRLPRLRCCVSVMANASRHALLRAPRVGRDRVPPPRSRFSADAASFSQPLEKSLFSHLRSTGNGPTTSSSFSPPPAPPPLPSSKPSSTVQGPCSFVSDHTLDTWDRIFLEGANADVAVCTDDGSRICAHSAVLMAISPVLKLSLQKKLRTSRLSILPILGVPFHAVRCFLRYLYSSRCERSDMDECALHLLVLAHAYMVPALKRLCTSHFEQRLLNVDIVVDVLQIARLCDAPRLFLLCLRRIIKDFKAVVRSDGWKAMKHSDPALEQEVIEAVIQASIKKQDKAAKLEDDQVYAQLYDAMEALTHLCRDGCRSVGSPEKASAIRPTSCSFPACRRLESLVRHFADCKPKVAGGCVHCKRVWQLLELHSRMCSTGDSCEVPLCRHFKDAVRQQASQKGELRWKMLVQRVKLAKRAVDALM